MTDKPHSVLVLCTGNSARSILAESLINHWGKGKLIAHSAGSFPKGQVHPIALALLKKLGLPLEGLRSKSWDEFVSPSAPKLDFVVTVCDNAAGEVCPIWPGDPVTAHWGVPDPAALEGSDAEKWAAFRDVFGILEHRIKAFTNLPLSSLQPTQLKEELRKIGTLMPEGRS